MRFLMMLRWRIFLWVLERHAAHKSPRLGRWALRGLRLGSVRDRDPDKRERS